MVEKIEVLGENHRPVANHGQICYHIMLCHLYIDGTALADVVEWSMALDIRLSDWCCNVSMVRVQILSREEQKFDSSKI